MVEYQQGMVYLPRKHTAMESLSETYREKEDSVLWINPVSKTITRGEEKLSIGYQPTYKDVIANYEDFAEQKKLVESGKQTDVKGNGGINQNWYNQVVAVQEAWKKGGKRGVMELGESGMLTGADFAAVKSVIVALKTTSTPLRNHIVLDVVTRMASDRMDLKVLDYQGYAAINEELGVWNIPLSGKGGFTSQTFSQKKYGWHLQWSEDFTMQVYDVDVQQYHVNALNGQIETVMNKKAVAPINALSGTDTATNWLTYSAGLFSNNAKLDVRTFSTNVDNSLRGSPRIILSNRSVYDAYNANTAQAGVGNLTNVSYGFGNEIVGGAAGFSSVRWAVDDLVTTDQFTVFDPVGILFVDGPQRTAQYEDTRTGIRGTIFKRWFVAKIIDATVFSKGTGIIT